jgi:DNA-binding transcriptional MerR regulator
MPDRLTTTALLASAQRMDPAITERTLEHWRHQGLLPKAKRTGQSGMRPEWTYPPEAEAQLQALLRMRNVTKDLNVLRPALWYEGYNVDVAKVRLSIAAYLKSVQAAYDRDLQRLDPDAATDPKARLSAIQAGARKLAAKRGKGFPRLGRQSLDDRADAVTQMLGMVFQEEVVVQHLEEDAAKVERLIGVDRGRRFRPAGAIPWLSGPPEEGLSTFASFGSVPSLIASIESATGEQMVAARTICRTVLYGIATFSRIADAAIGRDNASGMAGMGAVSGDPFVGVTAVPMFVSILRNSELAANTQAILDALENSVAPVETQARELAALPPAEKAERLKALDTLPPDQRFAVVRLIAEFSEQVSTNSNCAGRSLERQERGPG